MCDYSAKWELAESEPTIDKISFRAEPGQLIAIIGSVGAGKVITILHGWPLKRIMGNTLHCQPRG
jgi:ABC-type glutathione transport system ATPase component